MNIPPVIDFSKSEYDELWQTMEEKVFIFLGAGFSKQIGFKLWDELTKEIVNIFWDLKLSQSFNNHGNLTWSIKEKLLAFNEKKYVMDYLYRLDSGKYYEIIERIFKDVNKDTEIINILKPLVKDTRYNFLQTNIDNCFQEECKIPGDRQPVLEITIFFNNFFNCFRGYLYLIAITMPLF